MAGDTAVRVDDDLASGQTGIAGRSADDELAARVDHDLRVGIDQHAPEHRVDDQLTNTLIDILLAHVDTVMSRYDHGLDPLGLPILVLDGDLSLAVRTHKRYRAILALLRKPPPNT